jgi:hypothetical protein
VDVAAIGRRAALAATAILVIVGASATNATARTVDAKRSPDACTKAVDTLTRYVAGLDPTNAAIRRAKVYPTFLDCKTADRWRLRAERANIGPKLGALLGSPTLDTDRALDVLCQHFDAYDRTSTCKNRNGPDTQGSTTG